MDNLAVLNFGLPYIAAAWQLMKKIVLKLKDTVGWLRWHDLQIMLGLLWPGRVSWAEMEALWFRVWVLVIIMSDSFSFYIHIYTDLFNYILFSLVHQGCKVF